jgi:excisionase family DNA binding protein
MLMEASRLDQHHPWTPEEIAQAGSLHVKTVRAHIRAGLLPATRIGRRKWRVADTDARRYIGDHK